MSEPPGAPFTAFLGALLEEKRAGYARLSLKTDERHADARGKVHAGVLTSIMDSVVGISLGQLRGQGAREREGPHATIEMSASFYAWATPGDDIIAEGRVTHMDERVAFGEVETTRVSDGELLAKARLTFALPGRRD